MTATDNAAANAVRRDGARSTGVRPKPAPPRLPGTVAEIDASPEGPSIGAFFDLDGTLIAGFSAGVFANDRLRRRDIGVGEMARMVRFGIEAGLGAAAFA